MSESIASYSPKRDLNNFYHTSPPLGSTAATLARLDFSRIIEFAKIESLQLGYTAAGTEHLLLAILGEKSCRTAKILLTLGIDLKSARQKALQIFGRGRATLSDTATISPKAEQILRCASETGVEADPTDLIVIFLIDGEPNAASVLLERLSVDTKNLKNSLLE